MSVEKLTAYAMIGKNALELRKREVERLDKIKNIMGDISDEEYEQLLDLAKKLGDRQMLDDLPKMREMVKK